MSFPFPPINVAGATVGQTFTLDLTNAGIGAGGIPSTPGYAQKPANLWLYNDSGVGFSATFQEIPGGFNLPAGAWGGVPLPAGLVTIIFTVIYILPNPPVSLLISTYYGPNEQAPNAITLGNSPVGIGGSVQTSVSTLSNEGNPPTPILVIDIGNTSHTQLITIYNDGSYSWSVNVAGVNHTLMQGSIANLLQLGMLNDVSQVLGQLSVAQLLTASGGIQLGSVANDFVASGETGNNKIIDATSGTNLFLNPPATGAGRIIGLATNGVKRAQIDDTGITLSAGTINLLTGSLQRMSTVTFNTVNGTTAAIAHNLGGTPVWGLAIAYTTAVSGANVTIGLSEVGATTFKASSVAAVPAIALFGR